MRILPVWEARMGACETISHDAAGPTPGLILRRSWPVSRSLVQSGADGSPLSHESPPGNASGACPSRTLWRRRSRGWPWRPDAQAQEGVVPRGLVHQHGAVPPSDRPTSPRPLPQMGGDLLGLGIDWAEQFHVVALGRPDQGVIDIARVQHSPARSPRWLPRSRDWSRTRQKSGSSSRRAMGCWSSAWSRPATSWCRSTPM
jgi:hypothetical protein